MSDPERPELRRVAEFYEKLAGMAGQIVIGQTEPLRLVVATLLCEGHGLLEGVPGVAKTLLVRTLAASLGLRFGRIQFTPDLMPSDVTGSSIYDARSGAFDFRPGPVFTDLLLADEINRAPAKTQAALLEAMQERTVTSDGTTHPLPSVFTVFATQNPIEQEGTYPLPEAQLDRFLFKIRIEYPNEEDELRILQTHQARDPELASRSPVISGEDLSRAQEAVRGLQLREEILAYGLSLLRATRDDESLAVGGSTRAGVALMRAAKALAALDGRGFVLPDDVQGAFHPVLRHRIVLSPSAEVEGLGADAALDSVLRRVPVPH